MTPTHLVIHHSASRNNVTFQTIKNWHTRPKPHSKRPKRFYYQGKWWDYLRLPDEGRDLVDRGLFGNGWTDIGYHYVVTHDGKLHYGRPFHVTGAHVGGQNTGTIGCCVVGDMTKQLTVEYPWTSGQIMTTTELIHCHQLLFPNITVCGHGDLATTACPGVNVREYFYL